MEVPLIFKVLATITSRYISIVLVIKKEDRDKLDTKKIESAIDSGGWTQV